MGTGDLCLVPPVAIHPGRARRCSGTGPCEYCRRVLWVPGPRVSIRGKFVLSRNPGYKTRGGHHVAKRSSDPRVAYPEVNLQERDLVRGVGIVAPIVPRGFSIRGKLVLSSPRGKMDTGVRTHDRTSQKKYTRSLVLPRSSMRRELYADLQVRELIAKRALCGSTMRPLCICGIQYNTYPCITLSFDA